MSLAGKPLEILKRIPIFAELAPPELEALAEAVVVARYRKNQVLFVEGEPSPSLYFICSGRVKVYRVSPDGREQILHLLEDGDPIAVVPFFDGDPCSANAEVLTNAEIALIRHEDFERIAHAHPAIPLKMLRILARALRRSQEDISSLALKSVAGRLAARLLDLAERQGELVEDGIQIAPQLSRQELGSLVGASRETVTRVLQQFQRENAIRIEGPRIVILKPLVLQSWSEQ